MTSPVPGSSEMPQFPKLSGGLARTKRKVKPKPPKLTPQPKLKPKPIMDMGPNPPKLKPQPIMDMRPNPIRVKPGIPNGPTVGKVYKTY